MIIAWHERPAPCLRVHCAPCNDVLGVFALSGERGVTVGLNHNGRSSSTPSSKSAPAASASTSAVSGGAPRRRPPPTSEAGAGRRGRAGAPPARDAPRCDSRSGFCSGSTRLLPVSGQARVLRCAVPTEPMNFELFGRSTPVAIAQRGQGRHIQVIRARTYREDRAFVEAVDAALHAHPSLMPSIHSRCHRLVRRVAHSSFGVPDAPRGKGSSP